MLYDHFPFYVLPFSKIARFQVKISGPDMSYISIDKLMTGQAAEWQKMSYILPPSRRLLERQIHLNLAQSSKGVRGTQYLEKGPTTVSYLLK